MKTSKSLRFSAFILAVAVLFSSCASTTMITSIPSGAKVIINGETLGTTPYKYTDTQIAGTVINLDLVKEGYEPFYTSFSRTEQVNVGAIVGGLFFLVPFLWTMEYKPTHSYELTPLSPNESSAIPSSAQPATNAKSMQEQLIELKSMLDAGLIDEVEFKLLKEKILKVE